MNSSKLIFALICTIVLFSCKKKDDITPKTQQTQQSQQEQASQYSQLKVGNYWVYHIFKIDSLGNATSTNESDSSYIAKDTIINGYTYYKYANTSPELPFIEYLRDSGNYIVNSFGIIFFSTTDFSSIFNTHYQTNGNDTIVKAVTHMADKNFVVSTPIGNFNTLSFQVVSNIYIQSAHFTKYKMNTRYAKGVGIVIRDLPIYLGSYEITGGHNQMRLVRYHLN